MKSEKFYEFLVALENESSSSVSMRMVQEMKNALMKEMRASDARKNGTAVYIKAANAILKETAKGVRDCLKTAFIREDGCQYVTDGFRAYKFKKHIDVPTDGSGVALERIYENAANNDEIINENVENAMERCLLAISKFNARKKSLPKHKFVYPQNELGELVKFGKNYYDPRYLKDFLEVTTHADEYTIKDASNVVLHPIYSINKDGVEAVLLPVRV